MVSARDDLPIQAFASREAWAQWLGEQHATSKGVWVKIAKKDAAVGSVSYPEAIEVALCYGWIDGQKAAYDQDFWLQRFTPRKPKSNWSAVNIKKVEQLTERGLMRPAGLAAFARRSDDRSAIYAYENRHLAQLDPAREKKFRRAKAAWEFFSRQPPSYRQLSIYRVISAKREETREKRLALLIEASAQGRRLL